MDLAARQRLAGAMRKRGDLLRGDLLPVPTPHELRIARLRATGLTLRETAEAVGVSYIEAKMLMSNLYLRLGVGPEGVPFMRALRELGWLQVPE